MHGVIAGITQLHGRNQQHAVSCSLEIGAAEAPLVRQGRRALRYNCKRGRSSEFDGLVGGLDTNQGRVTRTQHGIVKGSVVFVSVGSCQAVKNHAAVIQALADIAAVCPDARYLHVGTGDLEASEQQLVADLGLVDRVIFAGSRDDIPDLLRSSDVFVMPSTHEGFAISCLEAMSCGLPVIASDAPGLRDLVVDRETGCLARSTGDLARAMAELYHGQHLRTRYGCAGHSRALAEFSLETSVASYIRLYRNG